MVFRGGQKLHVYKFICWPSKTLLSCIEADIGHTIKQNLIIIYVKKFIFKITFVVKEQYCIKMYIMDIQVPEGIGKFKKVK